MANLNPVAVVRDIDSSPQQSRQVHQIVGRIAGGGAHAVTVETKLKSVLSAIVINETDGAVVASTIAASTAYSGTQKVTFTVAASKNYSYIITGILARSSTTDTTGGATTVTYEPLRGG